MTEKEQTVFERANYAIKRWTEEVAAHRKTKEELEEAHKKIKKLKAMLPK